MAAVRSKRDLPPEGPLPRPVPRQWWEGEEPVELRLTANAGVLLTFRGEKLLVDGLHDSRAHDFSPVAPETLAALAAGAPPWDGIRWLFYTHLHIDHFSGRETIRFLEGNRVEKLFLPAGNGGPGIDREDVSALRSWLTQRAAPVQELRLPEYRSVPYPLVSGIRVTAFRSLHASEEFEEVEHECFLFDLAGKKILFLGDSNYDRDYFATMLDGVEVDTAVVNPLFLTNPSGRSVVLEGVRPRRVVIDHIPFQEDDKLHMRKLVVRSLERWGESFPPVAVLWEAGDTVRL